MSENETVEANETAQLNADWASEITQMDNGNEVVESDDLVVNIKETEEVVS